MIEIAEKLYLCNLLSQKFLFGVLYFMRIIISIYSIYRYFYTNDHMEYTEGQ